MSKTLIQQVEAQIAKVSLDLDFE
ncbi:hypothetical protein A0H81_09202 [Grifola frondosa]|uniref:Uncharacterized protein n=1 Tax=Grifola frondosa TaxID=5627 RepID=A0A1C7M1U3_GRIFR|nr:hypothetical protein A0H81_09202 [Grifola frondosa]